MGGELTDLLIVLRSKAAVKAFCGTFAAGLGGGISFAAGPLGRAADAGLTLGRRGATLAYSYSMSRGAFAGGPTSSWFCNVVFALVVCHVLLASHSFAGPVVHAAPQQQVPRGSSSWWRNACLSAQPLELQGRRTDASRSEQLCD